MTRILITAVVGCVLSGGIGYLLLPVLRALKAGQSIREIGPTWHNYKAGTPMMGGLMFVAAALICLLCNIPFMSDYSVLYVFAISLCFGAIGFMDDFCKMKKKQNMQKTFVRVMALIMVVALMLPILANIFGLFA